MCGGTAQTTQQVQIPPEVMQNYRAVNARATEVAATPFQQYSTDPNAFVAPLNQTQQAGIQNISNAGGISQPYFQGATSALMGGQAAATPYYGEATQQLLGGLNTGLTGTQAAYQPLQQGAQAAQGLQSDALNQYRGAFNAAQPYNQAAAAGIAGAYAGAQPYQGVATGLAAAGTQAVNAGPLGGEQINQYMSPYLNSVVGSTMANLRQQQGQEQSSLLGNQIAQGAFGGDRGRIAQANLARQQDLATGQTVSGLMNQGYGQALGAAQQQQQLGLGAAQANRAALQQGANQMLGIGQQGYGQGIGSAQAMAGLGQQQYAQQSGLGQNLAQLGQQTFGQGAAQSGQQAALAQQQYGMGAGAAGQMAGLGQGIYGMGAGTSQALAGMGTQAQQNALAAGQAQLGAGTVGQQTQQAGQTALYNQFLQQQGFPYQQAQFLANIAMGTGALSGSTTNTSQAAPFFSDKRLKEAVEPIGKTFDGQNIVKFRYKNEPGTRIGLIAQDVEKHHPEAVGLAGGYKTVDYDAATKDAASKGHYARGGLAPESEGGAVLPAMMRHGFAEGGNPAQLIGNNELAAILQAQFGMYNNQGIPGLGGAPGMTGFVPEGTLPVGNLTVADAPPALPESQLKGMIEAAGGVEKAYDTGKQVVEKVRRQFRTDEENTAHDKAEEAKTKTANGTQTANGGLVGHYASGGASSGPYGIPISKVETPDLITAGDAPEFQKSGFLKMLDMAGDAASLGQQGMNTYNSATKSKAAGGAAEDDVGSGTPYDAGSNPFMPDSAKGIEKKELAKPGAAPGAPESGFSQAMSAAKSIGSIAALAMALKRGGRTGYTDGGTPEDLVNEARGLLSSANDPKADLSQAEKSAMLATAESNRRQAAERTNRQYTTPEDYQHFAGAFDQIGYGAPDPTVWRKPSQIAARQTADANRESNRIAGLSAVGLSPQGNILPQARKPGTAVVQIPAGTFAGSRGTPRVLDKNAKDNRGPVRPAAPTRNVARPAVPPNTPGLIPTPTPRPDLDGDASPAITSANMAPGLGGGNPPPPISSDLAGSPAYQQSGLAPVQAPTDTHAAENALLARTGLSAPNIRQDLQKDANKKPSFLDKAERMLAPKGGYLDRLSQGDEDTVVSLLTGLGAMAGSSNRYGLGALAEGIGAGAGAYQKAKQNILERGQTKAETGLTEQQAGLVETQTYQEMQGMAQKGMQVVEGPGKAGQKTFRGPDGKIYHYEAKGTFTQLPDTQLPELSGAASFTMNPMVQSRIDSDGRRALMGTTTASDIELSGKIDSNVFNAANTAQADIPNQLSAISTITNLPEEGFYATGANQPFFQTIANKAMDIVNRFGLKDYLKSVGVNPDFSNIKDPAVLTQLLKKVSSATAFSTAAAADQTTVSGLENALRMAITADNPKAANAYLTATMLVADRAAIDQANFAQEYRNFVDSKYGAIPDAYMAQSMTTAFRADPRYSQEQYNKEKEALATFIAKTDPQIVKDIASGKYPPEVIDKIFKNSEMFNGVLGMSKYFIGRK